MIKFGILLICVHVCVARSCTLQYNPVCGSDGKIYSNECFFNGKKESDPNLRIVSLDKCPQLTQTVRVVRNARDEETKTPGCFCTFEYDPQCGSDGVTYPNKCTFECEKKSNDNLELKSQGECQEDEKKIKKSQEQKGAEKITTEAPTKFTCDCTDDYMPVCGSDGKTYPNKCDLNCAKNNNTDLKLNHPGECQEQDLKNGESEKRKARNAPDSCVCTFDYKPVCGSDGNTYPNRCALGCRKHLTPNLEIKHAGPCKSAPLLLRPSCPCTRERNPMCGTDGVTYNNPCLLRCATKNDNVQLKHNGPCEENSRQPRDIRHKQPLCACPKNLRRICATNGETYSNMCLLECAAKQNRNIKYRREGPC